MKDRLVIVGDSFCSQVEAWPTFLADSLDMDLVCRGFPGQPWWPTRQFLHDLDYKGELKNCKVMIFCHTEGSRIATDNEEVGLVNHHDLDFSVEIERAVGLHFKYIHSFEFLLWAQRAWFKEINETWPDAYKIHLHCFRGSWLFRDLLDGVHMWPDLATISFNELPPGASQLVQDPRGNHFSDHNNAELARQLHDIIKNRPMGELEFDLDRFQVQTRQWPNRSEVGL